MRRSITRSTFAPPGGVPSCREHEHARARVASRDRRRPVARDRRRDEPSARERPSHLPARAGTGRAGRDRRVRARADLLRRAPAPCRLHRRGALVLGHRRRRAELPRRRLADGRHLSRRRWRPSRSATSSARTASSARPAELAQIARSRAVFEEGVVAVCEVAELLAEQLGLSEDVQRDLTLTIERWDGKSFMKRAKEEGVPASVRVVQIAECAVVFDGLGGVDGARAVVRERAGAHSTRTSPRCSRSTQRRSWHRPTTSGGRSSPIPATRPARSQTPTSTRPSPPSRSSST